jgi:hypothetical protein
MKKVRRPGPQLPPGATSRPPPRQCSEYLLLVAFDALRAGYDRDQLREAFETGQSKRGKAAVKTHIGDAFGAAPLPIMPGASTLAFSAGSSGRLSSRPEEFHLRALPEPCMTLSSHTAPDVRPLP